MVSIAPAFLSPLPLTRTHRKTRTCRANTKMATASRETRPPALVIGAGIIGLTTAIRLHEANHNVAILAQETPSTILSSSSPKSTYTSSGAGGLWMPVLLEDPRIPRLATDTFETLASHIPLAVGVDMLEGFLVSKNDYPLPWYAEMTNAEKVTPESDSRVPERYPHAHRFTVPVAQMEKYLPYLESVVESYGIPVVLTRSRTPPGGNLRWSMSRIREFARDMDPATVVVNCAGMGGGALCDDTVMPGRGITLRVRRPKHITYHISENYEDEFHAEGLMGYAIPRGEYMTLGGTVFMDDWREHATEDEINGVRERAEALLGVKDLPEVARWTGLRPIRPHGVRLGVFDDVVCNYGHGGSGVTICWGCANEIVRIVETIN